MNLTHLYHRFRHLATLNNGVLVVAGIIVLSSIWSTLQTLQKNFILQQRVDLLTQQIKVAELEADTLELQQQYLSSPEYIELTARAKLDKALPGEKVMILPVQPKQEPVAATTTAAALPGRSNLEKWLQFFLGR